MAYRKQDPPTHKPDTFELGWAAGFLEGEGTFGAMSGTDHRARVSAGQKHTEPLYLLLGMFGGRVYHLKTREYHTWMLRGVEAHALMVQLRPFMSKRRQQQIDIALASSFSVPHGSPERFKQRSEIRQALAAQKEG